MLNNDIKHNIVSKMPLLEVKTDLGNKLVQTSEILYIIANNKHSKLFFNDLSILKSIHSLKWFNERLNEPIYFRCHELFLVNCMYFDYLCSYQVILKNRTVRIPLSRYRKRAFFNNLENLYKLKHLPEGFCNKSDSSLSQFIDYQI